MIRPFRGVTLIRPIKADDRIGAIYAPQQTIDRMTASQFEVVSIGQPEWCDNPKCRDRHSKEPWHDIIMCETTGEVALRQHVIPKGLKPGAWVYVTPRSWVETGERDLYAVKTSAILGVFTTGRTRCRSSS